MTRGLALPATALTTFRSRSLKFCTFREAASYNPTALPSSSIDESTSDTCFQDDHSELIEIVVHHRELVKVTTAQASAHTVYGRITMIVVFFLL